MRLCTAPPGAHTPTPPSPRVLGEAKHFVTISPARPPETPLLLDPPQLQRSSTSAGSWGSPHPPPSTSERASKPSCPFSVQKKLPGALTGCGRGCSHTESPGGCVLVCTQSDRLWAMPSPVCAGQIEAALHHGPALLRLVASGILPGPLTPCPRPSERLHVGGSA